MYRTDVIIRVNSLAVLGDLCYDVDVSENNLIFTWSID